MTVGALLPVIAFLISLGLNRARVDHFWCLAIAVAVPLSAVALFAHSSGHMGSSQEFSEDMLQLFVTSCVAASIAFIFRKREKNTSTKDING